MSAVAWVRFTHQEAKTTYLGVPCPRDRRQSGLPFNAMILRTEVETAFRVASGPAVLLRIKGGSGEEARGSGCPAGR